MDKACAACHGKGSLRKMRKIEVAIPRGVGDGQFLRIAGEGEAGTDHGPPGDLYAVVHVRKDPRFDRQGADLYSTAEVGLATALLGAEITVPTITGSATLRIPAGTQCQTLFRLRSQGMPLLNAEGRGDLMVKVMVRIPAHLTKKQEGLIREALAGSS